MVITYQILWEIREEFEKKWHKLGPTDKSIHSGHNNTSDMDLKYTLYSGVIHKAYMCNSC